MDRRKFIKNSAVYGGISSIGVGLYTWQIEPFWLEFTNVTMPIKRLPKPLVGKTIMQISDLHVGDRFDYNYLIESMQEAQEFNPDIVVYTGDFVSWNSKKQLSQLKEVMKSAVKGRLGTFGILGNHDYGHNWSQQNVASDITDILTKADIKVLRDEKTQIEGLNIIGLEDYWGPNFHKEMIRKILQNSGPSIVLSHNPDTVDLNVWQNYKGWILSGHTHGGQCKPPFLTAPMLPIKNTDYAQGLIDLKDGRTLYVNRALGHLHQIRFNVRPEITIFTLEEVV